MNELLRAMSTDMGIERFYDEPENSFVYRLCYSALGQWCLRTAQNSSNGAVGTTKHNQTGVLKELVSRYCELFPSVTHKFIDDRNHRIDFAVHVRQVYEETGYLLTDEVKQNRIANFGRGIRMGNTSMFFGIPNTIYSVNGLGVFSNFSAYTVSLREFLIRDNLTWEEYFHSQFDAIDFYDRDINLNELDFFNPLSNDAPSKSWKKQMETDYSVARESNTGPLNHTFYRVIRTAENSLQFAEETAKIQDKRFTSFEYRRLYFALKAHYKTPLKANVIKLDEKYSRITLRGQLPNREYYFLLLLSWPVNNAFDKVNFLLRNDFIPEVTAVLTNIGIEVQGGKANA